MTQNAAIAKQYGKRYITYEAGQHVAGPDRVSLVTSMQQSPPSAPSYQDFIAGMVGKTGPLTLHAATGAGARGLGAGGYAG